MRRCACGVLVMDDIDRCSLCGPAIPTATVMLIAGHLLRVGVGHDAAFETAEQIALDLDAHGLLAAPVCRYCNQPGGEHEICRQADERISELDALEAERAEL